MKPPRPTAIELFSGCGGLSTGLLDAGYNVVLGVDNNAPSMVAFAHNHEYRGSRSIVADVRELSGSDLLVAAGISTVDLLVGGPPCQPFSIAGKRKGLADPRAELVSEYIRIVGEVLPKAVVLENVPALVRADSGQVIADIVGGLESLGYTVKFDVLNAANYGVPQNRKRLIVVGMLGRKSFEFPPESTHGPSEDLLRKPFRTSWDALNDLPDVHDPDAHAIPNHEPTSHTPAMVEAFTRLKPGKREPGSYHDRLHPDRPGYTLRAGSGNFSPLRPVHYKFDRVLSVRESARLQGFSDDFVWPDSLPRLQQYRQVGNAVPPPLARVIGQLIASVLGWTLDPVASAGDIDKRPNGLTLTPDERHARRKRFQQGGASAGKRHLNLQALEEQTELASPTVVV